MNYSRNFPVSHVPIQQQEGRGAHWTGHEGEFRFFAFEVSCFNLDFRISRSLTRLGILACAPVSPQHTLHVSVTFIGCYRRQKLVGQEEVSYDTKYLLNASLWVSNTDSLKPSFFFHLWGNQSRSSKQEMWSSELKVTRLYAHNIQTLMCCGLTISQSWSSLPQARHWRELSPGPFAGGEWHARGDREHRRVQVRKDQPPAAWGLSIALVKS